FFQRALLDGRGSRRLAGIFGCDEIRIPFLRERSAGGKILDAKLGDQRAIDRDRTVRADGDFAGRKLNGVLCAGGLKAQDSVTLIGDEIVLAVELEAAIARVTHTGFGEHGEKAGAFQSEVGVAAGAFDHALRKIETRAAKNAEAIDGLIDGS